MLPAAIGEIIDITQHRVIHRERQLRFGGRDFVPHAIFQLRIDRESHLQDVFEGSLFVLVVFEHGGRA